MLESTIDWCEDNYIHSNYIAEYYNTLSSVFIALSGYIFNNFSLKNLHNSYTTHFTKIYIYLLLTAVGTFLFHGTLLFPFQLLDELPMLFISVEYIRILLKLYNNNKIVLKFDIKNLITVNKIAKKSIYLIPLSYFFSHNLQILHFHILLKIFEGTILYLLVKLSQNCNKIAFLKMSDNNNINSYISNLQNDVNNYYKLKKQKQIYTYIGISVYSASVLIWCLENLFCQYVKHYQLHAVWHFLSSIGIYYLNNIMLCYVKIDTLNENN